LEKFENIKIDEEVSETYVPEKALMLAILERALMDLNLPDTKNRRCALKWFMGESTDYIFSYKSCIETLDLTKDQIQAIQAKINKRV
jgi:hypothetical protein